MLANLSYWEKKNFFNADVVIIGSGIVGLNAAISIKKINPKIDVIILERGFLPSGASTKNAGFACFGSISELIEQEQICGTTGLHQLIEKRWKGLLKLRNLLGDDAIEFKNFGGFELFKPQENKLAEHCVVKITHYNYLIKDIVNQANTFAISNKKIKDFGFKNIDTLIENNLEAQLDPSKMMKALLVKAASLGVQILNNCNVISLKEEMSKVAINTNQGVFYGNKALITTNAFISDLIDNINVKPGRGQVIVTEPIADLKIKGTFHYNKGFYYFRNIDNRILLGGGRDLDFEAEETTSFGETEVVQQALVNLLKDVILPDVEFKIAQKWSGIMAFGPQLNPIIEEVKPNIFCAVRCNGMGIAIGSQTGQEAAEMIINSL